MFLPSLTFNNHSHHPFTDRNSLPSFTPFSFFVSLIPLIIKTHLDILSLNLFFALCFFLCWLCFALFLFPLTE
ncbi:hypothetical protein F5H01DRAFT_350160 [Linnemannia elongata]|nr:hypothetical protein F5H01DRAFT_350160 [Linnemannia elongata]